jgi:hypothetical protein
MVEISVFVLDSAQDEMASVFALWMYMMGLLYAPSLFVSCEDWFLGAFP